VHEGPASNWVKSTMRIPDRKSTSALLLSMCVLLP
jgi:hypothetical protein